MHCLAEQERSKSFELLKGVVNMLLLFPLLDGNAKMAETLEKRLRYNNLPVLLKRKELEIKHFVALYTTLQETIMARGDIRDRLCAEYSTALPDLEAKELGAFTRQEEKSIRGFMPAFRRWMLEIDAGFPSNGAARDFLCVQFDEEQWLAGLSFGIQN